MRVSRWIAVTAGVVFFVALTSVTLGVSYPDGRIDRNDPITAPTPPAPTPSPTPSAAAPSADRAPASTSGVWPGRPDAATLVGDRVDWCPAVKVDASAAARQLAGDEVTTVACLAVRYMIEGRLTRLAIPRKSYALKDFEYLSKYFVPGPFQQIVVPWLSKFVADPQGFDVSEGLSIFLGSGTTTGADHARAIDGRVFYGPAFTTQGYDDRAVWINPSWSTVRVTAAGSVLDVDLTASAALPVFHPRANRDDMMVISTAARLKYLKVDGGTWLIQGGSIKPAKTTVKPLKVHGN